MHTLAGEGIQVYRQGSHQRFPFTGGHFRDLTLVKHRAAQQLAIVMDHIPFDRVAAGNPGIMMPGLVADDLDVRLPGRQITVKLRRRHLHIIVLHETAGSIFHHGKGLGKDLHQHILREIVRFLLQLVQRLVQLLLLFNTGFFSIDLFFQLADLRFLGSNEIADPLLELIRFFP